MTQPIIIKPVQSRRLKDEIQEVWDNRELLYMLSRREVAVRYKQAVIGFLWVVLQPLIMTAIFTLIFSVMARVPTDGIPYPVFVFSALLVWQYFARVVQDGTDSLVKNSGIITKIHFPRLLIPLSVTASAAVDFFLAMVILFFLMLVLGQPVTLSFLMIPVFMVMAGLLGYGIALILGPLNAVYRDIGIAVPFLLQIGMFASLVMFPISFVPERYQWLFQINPVATIIEGMRWAVLGTEPPGLLAWSVLFGATVILLVAGVRVFRSLETTLADRI